MSQSLSIENPFEAIRELIKPLSQDDVETFVSVLQSTCEKEKRSLLSKLSVGVKARVLCAMRLFRKIN